MSSLAAALSDSATITKRNLIKVRRVPDLIVFATLSPIMFVLLFVYVFGSAIPLAGISYAEFLLPGILAQTVIFGSTITGYSLAQDLQQGLIDRFRSLPMARSAVLVGLTVRTPEVVNNASFIVIFPLTFIANTFVPTNNFPSVLKTIADWNPVSAVVQAARDLFGNTAPGQAAGGAWALQHPALYVLMWVALLLAVFVPLSVRLYQRTAGR